MFLVKILNQNDGGRSNLLLQRWSPEVVMSAHFMLAVKYQLVVENKLAKLLIPAIRN